MLHLPSETANSASSCSSMRFRGQRLRGATSSAAGGGPGTWDSVTPIWFNGASDVVWPNTAAPNGDEAIFGGATSGAVTLGEPINANIVTFNTDGYSVSGNTLTLSGTT